MKYNTNEEMYDAIGTSLRSEYDKLYKKSEKLEESLAYKGGLDETLTLGTDNNKVGTVALSIPSAALTAIGAGSFVLGTLAFLPVLNNLGREVGMEQAQFLENLTNFSKNMFSNSFNNFMTGFKLLSLPGTLVAASLPKKFIKEHRERKLDKIDEKLIDTDDINTMLEDIKNGRKDPTLNFPREFLSNVDLTENSKKFNIEILYSLAKYRDGMLKQMDGVIDDEELSYCYDNFISLIDEGKGASKSFSNDPYVKGLISNYYDEELEESTSYGRGR